MISLKRNLAANLIGRSWSALLLVALVPAYIRLIGIEAYGVVGFYATLQAVMSTLDLGLTTTANRELARLSIRNAAAEMRDLVRSLEAVYWTCALSIGALIVSAAPAIVAHWIHLERLDEATMTRAIALMGVSLLLQFPYALYSGGLMGLQRQVATNVILVVTATLRGVGGLLVLMVSPTLTSYFGWQVLASGVQTGLAGATLWWALPKSPDRPSVRIDALRRLYSFAGGVAAISVFATILTQVDKLVLSKLLSIRELGYYTMAGLVASGLYMFVLPIFSAVFPRLSQLVAAGDDEGVRRLYHLASQALAVAAFPAAVVLVFFAPEVLMVWTRDPTVVDNTVTLVRLLATGTALHAAVHMPYALQLANNWTSLALLMNGAAVCVLVPFVVWSTARYGAAGAASAWIVLNACYMVAAVQVMHRRLLPEEKVRWYLHDLAYPLAAALAVAIPARLLLRGPHGAWLIAAQLVVISASVQMASVMAAPALRQSAAHTLARWRSRSPGGPSIALGGLPVGPGTSDHHE